MALSQSGESCGSGAGKRPEGLRTQQPGGFAPSPKSTPITPAVSSSSFSSSHSHMPEMFQISTSVLYRNQKHVNRQIMRRKTQGEPSKQLNGNSFLFFFTKQLVHFMLHANTYLMLLFKLINNFVDSHSLLSHKNFHVPGRFTRHNCLFHIFLSLRNWMDRSVVSVGLEIRFPTLLISFTYLSHLLN